jgi:hypothetical protein
MVQVTAETYRQLARQARAEATVAPSLESRRQWSDVASAPSVDHFLQGSLAVQGLSRRKSSAAVATRGEGDQRALAHAGCFVAEMLTPAGYSVLESLRDGGVVEIRALRPGDRTDLIAAVGRASARSLCRRFFAAKRDFTEQEIAFPPSMLVWPPQLAPRDVRTAACTHSPSRRSSGARDHPG